jgi:hypothetical protein
MGSALPADTEAFDTPASVYRAYSGGEESKSSVEFTSLVKERNEEQSCKQKKSRTKPMKQLRI